MDRIERKEKNRERAETRTAYVSHDVSWIEGKGKWEKLSCFGAIHTQFEANGNKTSEWHYYISSRKLTAEELLHHARVEWTVETMHWILDVHFGEDDCRVEDRNVQKNLNMARKAALNLLKSYQKQFAPKTPLSHIMLSSLLDCDTLQKVLMSTA